MEARKLKLILITALLFIVGIIATCELTEPPNDYLIQTQDTLFMNQWRREKQEKLSLVKQYEKHLIKLEAVNDSLKSSLAEHKKTLAGYRLITKVLREQLKDSIRINRSIKIVSKNFYPLLDSLIVTQEKTDTLCDTNIGVLESMVANRDSSIILHRQVENNLRDLQKEQDLKTQYLTEQLNIAFKNQKRESSHNRLLAGGLLILSGITTSLLLTQFLK